MLSTGIVAAIVVSSLMGPLHIICTLGVFFLRDAPAFAVRVPRLQVCLMVFKVFAFALMSWLLVDPLNCPCAVVPFAFWLDWIGNCWFSTKTVFLLFRYEIQAALKKSKEESNMIAFDEKNFFVRHRTVLRAKTQAWIMLGVGLYIGLGNMIVLGIFWDTALEPCAHAIFWENSLSLGCVVFAWITSAPMMVMLTISSVRLRKFPNDNWQMGTECTFINVFSTIGASSCAIALITVPTFDGVLWVLFFGGLMSNFFQLAVPFALHRRTLAQLAKLDLKTCTSLDHLLQNTEFLESFGSFLRKEFSSENLFFWLEVKRLQTEYASLFTTDQHEADASESHTNLLLQAAANCRVLGSRCIGDSAPWQLNISGFAAQELEKSLRTLQMYAASGSTQGLDIAVAETLQTLTKMQEEVYELLRKDPYPRFLVTADAKKLDQNENFKRMIAAEKLEEEVQTSLGSTQQASTPSEGSSKGGSFGAADGSSSKKSFKREIDPAKKKRFSQIASFLTDPNSPSLDNSNEGNRMTFAAFGTGTYLTDLVEDDGQRESDPSIELATVPTSH